jgi:hypothetical protein
MQFQFEVGEQERHEVTFSFDKFWGKLVISVDGVPITREVRLISVSLVKSYEFVIGTQERHTVRIDKERKLLFAGFRPQICRAYVNGQLVAEAVA